MPTPEKEQTVRKLEGLISRSTIAIATDYRGLSVADISLLRKRLREMGMELKVVKNTLACIAAEKAGRPGLAKIVIGPTAIAFGYGDVVESAKALTDHIRNARISLAIRGAVLDGRVLSPEEVTTLVTLPPREILVAQVIGGIQAPIASLIYVLNGTLMGLLTVLQGRIEQLNQEAS